MIGTSLLFSGSIGGLLTPFDSVAPTAGYSLRNLGLSYSGAVVRVRKDITGNPEEDFTAGQITNGTLSDFLETLGTDAHSQSVSTQFEDLSDVSLICDCNSGGTDELDAFDALYENGFVSKWYDQFGSNDAEQTTAAEQPKIWDASTGLVTENGKPTLDFDGVDDGFTFDSSVFDIGSLSSFAVGKYNVLGATMLFGISGSISNKRWYAPFATNTDFRFGYADNSTATSTTGDTNQHLFTMIAGSILGNMESWIDNSSVGTATLDTGIDATNGIGNFDGGFFADCNVQEIIIYNTDQSANRTEIEDNINDYYDIY